MSHNGETSKLYRDWDAEKKAKRAENLSKSTIYLTQHGIKFESLNNGIHLKVKDFDFWPSTGKFINRKTKQNGRGVFNLVKLLGEPCAKSTD